jgi:hypothetical protein
MTLLRPHIVAAASISRGATSGALRTRAVARRARGRWGGAGAPCQDGDRHGANVRERTPERTALDLQMEADDCRPAGEHGRRE